MRSDQRSSVLVGVLALGLTVAAPRAAAERVELTVATSYERARRHSHVLKQRVAQQHAAAARRGQARGAFLPRLEIAARFSRVEAVEPGRVPTTTGEPGPPLGDEISSINAIRTEVVQPLFTGFGNLRRYEAARLGEDVAAAQRAGTELDLRLEVEQAYFATYLALELEAVARQAIEVLAAHLDRVRGLYRVARATELDLAHAEARLADAEVSLEEARERVAGERAQLVTLLGLPADAELALVEPPDDRAPAPAELPARALANRPELRIARVASRVEAARVGAARAEYLPRVSAFAGYLLANPNERHFPPEQAFHATWEVGLALGWTLDWGITGARVAEAEANARAAAHEVAALEDRTRAEAVRAEAALATADRRVAAARTAVDASTRAFAAAERTFELGRLESTQLLDRELELRRARARLVQALVDRRLARARARRLIGVQAPGG